MVSLNSLLLAVTVVGVAAIMQPGTSQGVKLGAALALAANEPAELSGDVDTDDADTCGWIFDCGIGHKVQGPSGSGVTGLHDDCRLCEGGDPIYCHNGCNVTALPDAPLRPVHYRLAVEAATAGDTESLLALAGKIPDLLSVNRERNAIQLMNCDQSSVIVSLSLPGRPIVGQ